MAQGIFTKRQQLRGLVEKSWNTTPQAPLTNSFTSYAGVFNGTSQYLNLASPSQFNFGTNDLTIECFVNLNNVSYATTFFDLRGAGLSSTGCFNFCALTYDPTLIYNNNDYMALYLNIDTTYELRGQDPITLNVWHHVALCRKSNTFTMYLDGVPQGSYYTTGSYAPQSTNRPVIGLNGYSPTWYYPGQLSNMRVLNGTALYSGPFTPPTGPLTAITNTVLLTLNSSTIVDNSSYAATITNNGSATTTSTTISVSTPPISLGSTPTVEYLVVAGGGSGGSGTGGGGGAGGLLQGITPVIAGTSLTVTIGGGGSATNPGTSGSNSVFGAITAIGGGTGANNNGVGSNGGSGGGGGSGTCPSLGGQATFGQGNAGAGNILGGSKSPNYGAGGGGGAGTVGSIGTNTFGGNGGAGIASAISGKVTAYAGGGGGGSYASGPVGSGGVGGGGTPTGTSATSSGSANTGGGGGGSVNNNFSSANGSGGSGIVIISYSDLYSPATVSGGYIWSLTSGAGSLYFNGSSQYLAMNQTANLGSGNFTIEGWFNASSLSANNIILDTWNTSPTNSWQIYLTSSAHLAWYNASIPATSITGSTTLQAGAWYHFAVVRSGTTVTTYINGVQDGTVTDSTNYNNSAVLWVGAQRNTGPNAYFPGNLSNLRIVVGTAVYTAPFTPPTSPLKSISGTQLLLSAVSGSPFADGSGNNYVSTVASAAPTWNDGSPFPTGYGYKNRVYAFQSSGTIKF